MLRIIRGLPGSGKSYYARNSFNGTLVIEADQRFMTDQSEYVFDDNRDDTYTYIEDMLICAFMHKLQHVIVTTSSGHASSIQKYINIATKYGHETQVAWMDYLNGGGPNNHNVPKEVIDDMKNSWELYPNEVYIRRVRSDWVGHDTYHIVKDPPPWFVEIQKKKGVE